MQILGAVLGNLLGSLVNLNGSGHYVHWGFIQISVANLVLIGLMVVVFIAAILVPFRRHGGGDQ
jgi:membrane protein YqaA with SNARE-associated domain